MTWYDTPYPAQPDFFGLLIWTDFPDVMCTMLHPHIHMSIKMTSNGGVFFIIINLVFCHD